MQIAVEEKEVNELFNKLKIWFPIWWKTLEEKHALHLQRQREWKRKNGWKYRRKKNE